MKKLLLFISICTSVLIAQAQIKYPLTRKVDTVDIYHGTSVPDPYRWLEDDNSEETKTWVQEQNKITFNYLSNIPSRDKVRQRLKDVWNYTRYGTPSKEGDYYYFFKNDGLQNQSVWYRQKNVNDKDAEVFMDPNKLSEDGTVSLGTRSFNKKGNLLAYAIQRAGSDWQQGYVMEVKNKKLLQDKLDWLKFTGFSWKGEEGFYYSRYPEPQQGQNLKGRNLNQTVYFHKLGTPQSEDVLIYEDKEHPQRFASVFLTEDERFLVLQTSEGTSGSEIQVKNLQKNQQGFTLIIPGFKTEANVVDNIGSKLLVRTNEDAPNYKIVLIDPDNPAKQAWKTVIPEKGEVLEGVGTVGGYLFTSYLKDASTKIYQYTYEGKIIREIP
ncbi:MAG: S9 family peptidase, partial [Flavisolibacter sp.]|nr:S9 family peptidase [Flavisolibacter sp.]